mgnify:CR=1 FL=1
MIRDHNPTKVKQNQQKLMRCVRIRRKIGIILCVLSILASIYGIFVIAANKNEAENLGWQIDFAITLFQDMVLGPTIFLVIQLIFFKITKSNKIKNAPIKTYISAKFLDKNVAYLYAKALKATNITLFDSVNRKARIKRQKRVLPAIKSNLENAKSVSHFTSQKQKAIH